MAQQGNWLRCCNEHLSVKTCDPSFLPSRPRYLHIIMMWTRTIWAMKYISTWLNFLFSVVVSCIPFFLEHMRTSANCSSATLSSWPSRTVSLAIYLFQSGLSDARSLIWVVQPSIMKSHCSRLGPTLFLMVRDWAISQTCSLNWLSFHSVVEPPFSYHILMVSAGYWLTPIPAFPAQRRTCWLGIWIELPSAMIDFNNRKASQQIWHSQPWWMIEWWILNAHYSTQASGVLNSLSWVMRCSCSGE